jgi:hypothetical protein
MKKPAMAAQAEYIRQAPVRIFDPRKPPISQEIEYRPHYHPITTCQENKGHYSIERIVL